jgi:hypothetical protein
VTGGANAAKYFREALIAIDGKGSFGACGAPARGSRRLSTNPASTENRSRQPTPEIDCSPLAVGYHQCCIDAPPIALPADRSADY